MADIEFDDLGDRRYPLHVLVVKPVAGMHDQAEAGAEGGRLDNALELRLLFGAVGIGVVAGMQLDDWRPGASDATGG